MTVKTYGFVYRDFAPGRGLFYNGDLDNLKYCYDADEARRRWDLVKDNIVQVTLKRPPNQTLKINVPLVAPKEVPTIDNLFEEWVVKSKLSIRLQATLVEFLKYYYFDGVNFVKKDAERKIERSQWGVLMTMKDVLLGMFRLSSVKIKSGFDRVTNQDTYSDWNFSQDVEDVEYVIGGKKYKTNIYGVYAPQVKRAMLGEKYDGSPLQNWQNDAWFKLGRLNYVVGSRGLGKSYLMTAFAGCTLMKELASPIEKERPFVIHYFGLSDKQNYTVAMYIKKMMLDLIDDKRAINWKSTENRLVFRDGKQERIVEFKTQNQVNAGKGDRPNIVIIDEADRMDYEVYKTAIGTLETQVICISTIDYDAKKSRFWDLYQGAVIKQTSYEPIDDMIHRLWTECGLNKVKNREEIYKLIDEDVFGRVRKEIFMSRPVVGLKYTIDDDQNKTEREKQLMIDSALEIGEEFCLAEYFGEIPENNKIFNYEGVIESDIPDRFDYGVLAYDEAESFDNAGLVAIGVLGGIAYIISSERLTKDISNKYGQIKQAFNILKSKCVGEVLFAADCTRGDAYYREITEKTMDIDYAIKYTPSKQEDATYRRPYWMVGKKYLVDVSRNEFFHKANVRIFSGLSNEGGLVDELSEFKQNEKGRFEAKRGKDDQVNAMMIGLFAAYYAFLRDEYIGKDKRGTFNRDEYLSMLSEKEAQKEENERYDKIMGYVHAHFR